MSTAFDADAGTYQGRIPSSAAPEGSYVYELGHARAGTFRIFLDGDNHTTAQASDFTSEKIGRCVITLRPPADIPVGLTWTVAWDVGGGVTYSRDLVPGRSLTLRDVGLNLIPFSGGTETMTFSLTVTAATADAYVAEMPSVQLDAILVEDATEGPVVMTRSPEPGEEEVPSDSTISWWLTDADGVGVITAGTQAYVNGLQVIEDGVAVNGWGLVTSTPDALTVAYVLTPPADFTSSQVVTVRVVGFNDDKVQCDVEWTFTAEDTLAPELERVLGFARSQVLVRFNEVVELGDGTSASSALNIANYALALSAGAPAFVPNIIGAAALAGDTVLLTLDEEMTPGGTFVLVDGTTSQRAIYELTITNVADAAGNVVVAPGLVGLFAGYACPPVPGRKFSLYNLMPAEVRSADKAGTRELEMFLACFQEVGEQILCDIDDWANIIDPDLAPEAFVDAMLVDLGNPFEEFSNSFTLTEKRKLAQLLVPISKLKGTDVGMISAIRLLTGLEVTIFVPAAEDVWSLGDSELGVDTYLGTDDIATIYSFYVVAPVELTDEQRSRIRKIVAYMRRAPTHLLGITEPDPAPIDPDDWELGLSYLGEGTILH